MPASDADDLVLIADAVREAGKIARSFYGQNYRRWSKSRGEPVTEADMAIDRFLRGALEGARSEYGWLSEETGRDGSRTDVERTFIVDPIDGTTAFLKERPHFAISVAVAERGLPVVGAIYNPILEEFFTAARGRGAQLNGTDIHVSECGSIEGCRMLGTLAMFSHPVWSGPPLSPWPAMQIEARSSIAYRMSLVAAGRFDAAVVLSSKRDWDMAAGDVIVREAGGLVTSKTGRPLRYDGSAAVQRSMVCAGPRLHALLIDHVRNVDFEQREKRDSSDGRT